jgi:isoquinoline 1-oxidoreductase beta subunit
MMSATLDGGRIAGWKHRVIAGSVALRMYGRGPVKGVDGGSVDGATDQPYDIPNWQVEYTQAEPRAVNLGWWRGVGPNNNVFAIESFVDELAIAAKKDPIDFRLAMLDKEPRLANCLRLVRDKSNWDKPLAGRAGRGVGIQNSFGSFMATVAEVEVDKNGDLKVRRYTCVVDCGAVVNPDTVRAQVMGGIIFGLSAALYGDITVERGRIQQSNFHDYRMVRIHEAPPVDVHIITNNEKPGGIGEPGTTAAIPCLANAIADATGIRLRKMPIDRDILAGRKKA